MKDLNLKIILILCKQAKTQKHCLRSCHTDFGYLVFLILLNLVGDAKKPKIFFYILPKF